MSLSRFLVAAALSAALLACSTTDDEARSSAPTTTTPATSASAVECSLGVDDDRVGRRAVGWYTVVTVAPGSASFLDTDGELSEPGVGDLRPFGRTAELTAAERETVLGHAGAPTAEGALEPYRFDLEVRNRTRHNQSYVLYVPTRLHRLRFSLPDCGRGRALTLGRMGEQRLIACSDEPRKPLERRAHQLGCT